MECQKCAKQLPDGSQFCPYCGNKTSKSGEFRIVEEALSDKYEIVSELGRGGMAVVYKAKDKTLGRMVAIKVLPLHLSSDEIMRARFLQEAKSAANLHHPNIVTIFEAEFRNEICYIVMEFLEGTDLDQRIRNEGNIALPESSRIIVDVATALDYAHSKGLVHRDVKPSNIFISPDGRVVLTDFGIAKASDNVKLTQTGTTMGTPEYMSPEQVEGRPNIDGRSDIYALGVVFYQTLIGTCPFTASSPMAVAMMHIREAVPSAAAQNQSLPAEVDLIIARAMAKDVNQRYQSARQMADDLNKPLFLKKATGPTIQQTATPAVTSVMKPISAHPTPTVVHNSPSPWPPMPVVPEPQTKKKPPFTLILIIVLGVAALAAGAYFGINLLNNTESRQSEAKTNLGAIFTSQVAFFGENNTYGQTFQQINWFPEGKNRYSYFLAQDVIQAIEGGPYQPTGDIYPYVTQANFRVIAVGNIDSDPALDVWIIDEMKNLTNVHNDIVETESNVAFFNSEGEMDEGDSPGTLFTPSYVVCAAAVDNLRSAERMAEDLRRQSYPAGHLWIPDWASLSGAHKYLVYIGPFTTVGEAKPYLASYKLINSSAYGIKVDNKPGRYTFTASTPSADSGGSYVPPDDLLAAIERYAQTENAMDLDAHMALYGRSIDFYGKTISQSELRDKISPVFMKSRSMEMVIDNINRRAVDDNTAVVEFNKYFRFLGKPGKNDFCGEVLATHTMKKENGRWVIVGIKERSVIWVERKNCSGKSRYNH